jgi:small subunit ribosomal protein S9
MVTKKKTTAKKPAAKKPVKAKVEIAVKEKPAVPKISAKTFHAVGKRKSAVAQILLSQGTGKITINELPFENYFETPDLMHVAMQALTAVGLDKKVNVRGKTHGGGIHAQAESFRHATARALIIHNPETRPVLKKHGFLTRDSRVKERKKPGLKRARRAPQFSKR